MTIPPRRVWISAGLIILGAAGLFFWHFESAARLPRTCTEHWETAHESKTNTCEQIVAGWYYNRKTGECESYVGTGCNEPFFRTAHNCENTCRTSQAEPSIIE